MMPSKLAAMPPMLFPFIDYWWLYAAFTGLVLAVLAVDLGWFHRKSHAIGFREALIWSVVWVVGSLMVNLGLWVYASWTFPNDARLMAIPGFDPAAAARGVGLEFLAGYMVEKALAVDNVFVIAMLFSYFAVPAAYQHRVLFYGILGALVFRALFIALGAVLLQYQWVVWVAGGFLVLTGIKMAVAGNAHGDPARNPVLRLMRRFMRITPTLHGDRFIIRQPDADGRVVRWVTPLFVVLILVEVSDIIFAIDSVPAIFAITSEPLLVFTSNICAILGLRAMYFLLAGIMDRFHLLKYGLALILVFVGLKMIWLNDAFGGKFPIGWSLGIIAAILAASVLLSLIIPSTSKQAGR